MKYALHVKVLLINRFTHHYITLRVYNFKDKPQTIFVGTIDGVEYTTCAKEQKIAKEMINYIWDNEKLEDKIKDYRGY